jgi:uncharacterized membrane protein YdcZ (DUF606 family)
VLDPSFSGRLIGTVLLVAISLCGQAFSNWLSESSGGVSWLGHANSAPLPKFSKLGGLNGSVFITSVFASLTVVRFDYRNAFRDCGRTR